MNLVADTNVWYDIGAGRRNPTALKSGGNRLIATPTSLLEIASLIDDRTFADRRAAAQAVISHADEVADDCESHLARLWGLHVVDPPIAWIEGFQAIAKARSPAELDQGVRDFDSRVIRTVKVAPTQAWRMYHWNDFQDQVLQALDQHISGYLKARSRGRSKQLNKENAKAFAEGMRSQEVREGVLCATFIRALSVASQAPRVPTREEHDAAEPLLSAYVAAYIEYIIGCATQFAPQPNDLGDSECFLYLQQDWSFLSSDTRWVKLARRACPSRVHDPENKVPN